MTTDAASLEPDKGSRIALVSGGTAGLGFAIAAALRDADYHVVIVGRDASRTRNAVRSLSDGQETRGDQREDPQITGISADVTSVSDVDALRERLARDFGRLDVLINAVGMSDRGTATELPADRLHDLVTANLVSAMLPTQAMLPMLRAAGGSVVNIGSLASRLASRYLGGYPASKHALAGWTGQLRMECHDSGVHVALVCPGPIRRDDAGQRYDDITDNSLPKHAGQPGGGVRLRGLAPEAVASAVLTCIRRRRHEIVLPRKARLAIIACALSPRLGEWMIRRNTGS